MEWVMVAIPCGALLGLLLSCLKDKWDLYRYRNYKPEATVTEISEDRRIYTIDVGKLPIAVAKKIMDDTIKNIRKYLTNETLHGIIDVKKVKEDCSLKIYVVVV